MTLPRIRPMTPADVEPVAAAFLRENWGDRRLNLDFVTRHAETHPFVAEADGQIVGTGVLSVNGSVGWIGTIWVEPAWRRQGVGMALTQATIDAAESAGCRTLLLVATDAGRPLYEKIGFEVQTWYRILEAPGLGDAAVDPGSGRTRRPTCPRWPSSRAAATGEDRMHLLAAFAIARDGDLPRGATTGRWAVSWSVRRGAAARRSRRASRTPRRSCTPVASAADQSTGSVPGFSPRTRPGSSGCSRPAGRSRGSAPRLIRGEPLRWQPEAIWGQFNHAVG